MKKWSLELILLFPYTMFVGEGTLTEELGAKLSMCELLGLFLE